MEVPAGVGNEATGHESPAHEGTARLSRLEQPLGDTERNAVSRDENPQAGEVVGKAVLLGHLDEIVPRLMKDRTAHGK